MRESEREEKEEEEERESHVAWWFKNVRSNVSAIAVCFALPDTGHPLSAKRMHAQSHSGRVCTCSCSCHVALSCVERFRAAKV